MKKIILALILLPAISFASKETLFNTLSANGDLENSMGGRSFVTLQNITCMQRLETSVTEWCEFEKSSGKRVLIDGSRAANLLIELKKANATSYVGVGFGKGYFETKKISCLKTMEFSSEGEPLNMFAYDCSVELKLYDLD